MPFLSVYLDLSTGRRGMGRLVEQIESRALFFREEFAGDPTRRRSFERSLERVRLFLDTCDESSRGAALFICSDPLDEFFLAVPLPAPVETRMVVDSVPHIAPLVELEQSPHHFVVLVSDSEKAKVFEVLFNRVEDLRELASEADAKSFRGEWTRMHYQNWKRDKRRRFVKRKIQVLAELMSSREIPHLVLFGDESVMAEVRREMPRWLEQRVVSVGRLGSNVHEREIITRALSAFAHHERSEDREAVEILRQEIAAGGLGLVGLADVVEAINLRNIDELLVSSRFGGRGRTCPSCDWLSADATVERCGSCGEPALADVDLRQEAMRKAYAAGAYIEPIEHSDWLERHGGIGALLRYRRRASDERRATNRDGVAESAEVLLDGSVR